MNYISHDIARQSYETSLLEQYFCRWKVILSQHRIRH